MHYQAHINYDIPIKRFHNTKSEELLSGTLDAVYILSIGSRNHIFKQIKIAEAYTKKVFILNSKNKIQLDSFSEKVEIIYQNNFNTCIEKLESTKNPTYNFDKNYDIPGKRNYALSHAREKDYSKILLLDDDMVFSDYHLKKGIDLLSNGNSIVGFYALNFADVSTFDHIARNITRASSKVSIGGNFLFLDPKKVNHFFPYCYNEDWIFILSNLNDKNNVASGGFVGHQYHEPWFNEKRIQFETFGDIIIHGWKHCFKNQEDLFNKTPSYWQSVLDDYESDCKLLISKAKDEKTFLSVLDNTLQTLTMIKSVDLFNFIKNYKSDGTTFR